MLPMKKCNKCDHIFKSPGFKKNLTCPRCGSRLVVDASKLDIDFYNKNNKKN